MRACNGTDSCKSGIGGAIVFVGKSSVPRTVSSTFRCGRHGEGKMNVRRRMHRRWEPQNFQNGPLNFTWHFSVHTSSYLLGKSTHFATIQGMGQGLITGVSEGERYGPRTEGGARVYVQRRVLPYVLGILGDPTTKTGTDRSSIIYSAQSLTPRLNRPCSKTQIRHGPSSIALRTGCVRLTFNLVIETNILCVHKWHVHAAICGPEPGHSHSQTLT